jgi:hypothetical protein
MTAFMTAFFYREAHEGGTDSSLRMVPGRISVVCCALDGPGGCSMSSARFLIESPKNELVIPRWVRNLGCYVGWSTVHNTLKLLIHDSSGAEPIHSKESSGCMKKKNAYS